MKKILLILLIFFGMNVVYGLEFNQFDPNDINSLREATKYYQQEYDKKRGTVEAEEDYLKLCKFLLKFENIQNSKIYLPHTTSNNSIKKQITAYSKQFYKYGLAVQFDEGEFMLVSSNSYVYKNFAPYLSRPWKEILKFNSSDERIISDGRYVVPISYFKNQKKFFKSFTKKYPDFYTTEEFDNIFKSIDEVIKHYPNIYY